MIFRALDSDNDWTFGKGKQNYATGLNAIKLNVGTRLKSWKGNCFFAEDEGVDWNNLLDVGTKNLLDADLKRVILQSEGILRINSFESEIDRDTRDYSASTEILTIYGVSRLEV
jgi:hypothetical protein